MKTADKKNVLLIVMYETERRIYDEALAYLQKSKSADRFNFQILNIHRYLMEGEHHQHELLLEDYISHHPVRDLAERMKKIESEYHISGVRSFYKADPLMAGISHDKALDIVRKYFDAVEKLLQEHPFDIVFLFDGGEIAKRVLHVIAAKRGIKIFYDHGIFFPQLMAWAKDEMATMDNFTRLSFQQIPAHEIDEVKTAIEDIKNSQRTFLVVSKFRLRIRDWSRLYSRAQARLLYDRWNYRFRIWFYVRRGLMRICRSYFEPVLYEKVNLEKIRFVFYPLHVTDDAVLTNRAPHIDQMTLIQNIADALPSGYVLCVKGHPAYIGGYPFTFLRQIKQISGVKLLDPLVHPHDLLRKAAALLTVNSTAGYEALAFDVPLITFGPSFYRDQGLSYDVENMAQLPLILRQALERGIPYTQEQKLAFFYSIKKCSLPGPQLSPLNEMTSENILGYARAIETKLENL